MRPPPPSASSPVAPTQAPTQAPTRAPTQDEASLRALEQALFSAIARRDRTALEGLLTPDFVLISDDGVRVERAAFLDGVLAIPGEILSIDAEHLDARIVGGAGILSGVQRARVRLADGSVVEDRQVFTDVCVWRDGRWLLAYAHSVSAPPPAISPSAVHGG